jgi:hypothetical protein
MTIARNPLHGSGRAALPHPALASGDNAKPPQGVRVTNARRGQPPLDKPAHPLPSTPAVSHFWISRTTRRSAIRCSTNFTPAVVDGLEKPTDVGIEHPVHLLRQEPGIERIQRLVRVASRPESVGEAEEVSLVDRVHHLDRRALDELVFQRGDAQRPRPPVGLGDVRPLDRPRSIRPSRQPSREVPEVLLEGLPVSAATSPRRSPAPPLASARSRPGADGRGGTRGAGAS